MAILKFFIAILLLNLINKGVCECDWSDIIVGTVPTGREVQGKPEWRVTVINNCICPQSGIELDCKQFQTVEDVDPSVLMRKPDGHCLLNLGNTLGPSMSVTFNYAWDSPSALIPLGSGILCNAPGLKTRCCLNKHQTHLFCCPAFDGLT
ncbi:uncharacterized protein At1g05835-like [Cornus florida]|uniref:uncharacterized protein At1g05835-like n=1 Tax=Cornus florida TaxID=4283 RepID=UPI00289D0010|nr:uncharacterized protein At1g05835-like [Cornus florida]